MKFNSTEQAVEFGKVASVNDITLMARIRNVMINQFENMLVMDSEDLNLMAEIATQGQLMRESIEASCS